MKIKISQILMTLNFLTIILGTKYIHKLLNDFNIEKEKITKDHNETIKNYETSNNNLTSLYSNSLKMFEEKFNDIHSTINRILEAYVKKEKTELILTLLSEALQKNRELLKEINKNKMSSKHQNLKSPSLDKLTNYSLTPYAYNLTGHSLSISSMIEISKSVIATGSLDKTISLWTKKNEKFEETQTLYGHTSGISSLIKLTENLIVSASSDKSIKLWREINGKFSEIQTLTHDSYVYSLAKLSNNSFASASIDVKLWKEKNGMFYQTQVLKGHSTLIYSIIKLSCSQMVTGSYDGIIKVWEEKNGKFFETQTLSGHQDNVSSLIKISKSLFASGSWDKTIKIWKENNGMFYEAQTIIGHSEGINCLLKISANLIASGSSDKSIKLWEEKNGRYKEMNILIGHTESIESMLKLANGTILSGSDDGTIKLWVFEKTENNNEFLIPNYMIITIILISSLLYIYHKQIKKTAKVELPSLIKSVNYCVSNLLEVDIGNPTSIDTPTISSSFIPIDYRKLNIDQSSILSNQEVFQSFSCKICLSIVKNPRMCIGCEDLFCNYCIEDWIAKYDSCPYCRSKPFNYSSKLNKTANEIYNTIEISCPLKCKDNFTMDNLETHFKLCNQRDKIYDCNMCLMVFTSVNESEEHKIECREITFECNLCKDIFKRELIKDHSNFCEMRPVKCEFCFCFVPFKYVSMHRDYLCDIQLKFREILLCLKKKFD